MEEINEWDKANKRDRCDSCNHTREEHSDLEQCLGNDSHSCEKIMWLGKAKFKCACNRFIEIHEMREGGI